MAENILISKGNKSEKYESLLPQIKALIAGETNLVANLANISAVLKQTFGWFWVGFYLVDSKEELVLGPFQGELACTRIRLNKGVCGTAWATEKTIIVADVDAFPGHIACSSASKSEIVVPVFKNGHITMVLDVDSDHHDDFDNVDQQYLEKLATIISEIC
ncbi:GAF domain-containing protein [Putridiphycobacter roseus]|uniref:GAF domain-containing protein n=1 Tax=Putridiphycobacter roseus TaxID=2219161 RepID=A0A2W1NE88_9FLAO|nr:GAF domain-containing protein [Putridiphycobacter roseus]PZE16376.1 GAF domain-containing protein [Putridiphycobacter roseus]